MPKDNEITTDEYEIPYVEPGDTLEEFLIEVDCWSLFQDYHKHKDAQGIAKAIRERPELFQSATFRHFIADVLDGSYKPMKSGFVKKSTVEKARRICATVSYYENMGLPIQYESSKPNKLCASLLAAERTAATKMSVLDILKKAEKLTFGSTAYIGDGLYTWDGTCIWILNGFSPPTTVRQIQVLQKHLKSLTRDEYKRLKDFAWGYNPRKIKPLRNEYELEQANKALERHQDYEFIKSVQVRPISIHTKP